MKILSTTEVLDRHLRSFEERNVDALLADYSPDAVLFVPTGPLKGPAAIKPLYQAIISEFQKPGACFKMHHRCVDSDYAYILWSAQTEDNWYEFGTCTFVVRNGKIVAQSFAAKIGPKPCAAGVTQDPAPAALDFPCLRNLGSPRSVVNTGEK